MERFRRSNFKKFLLIIAPDLPPCATIQVEVPSEATGIAYVAGKYALREGETTNGQRDWLSTDHKQTGVETAIWYLASEGGRWIVGPANNRGSNSVAIYSDHTSQLYPIVLKWKYVTGIFQWSNFTDAVSVKCTSGEYSMDVY